jgi:hypothetical protein
MHGLGNIRVLSLAGLAIAVLAAIGCSSSQKILIPPRVDLARYGTIGMIEFTSQDGRALGGTASREFLAAVQAAQPGTPILELGDERFVLSAVKSETLDPEAIRSIGEKYKVDAVVVGVLGAQEVKPRVSVAGGLDAVSASAELEGLLNARILLTDSGATVWTTAARAKETVARVDLSTGGISGAGVSGKDDAKNRLVRSLIHQATEDFWARWEKQ